MSDGFRLIDSVIFLVPRYKPAHKLKFRGVIIVDSNVDTAVKLTDRARLTFARDEKKLDIFPPGQAETSIIPKAKPG
jgi:hypothetical protein